MRNNKILLLTLIIFAATNTFGQPQKDSVVDIDKNVYHTIKIGTRIWMMENLRVTRFNNGDKLSNIEFSFPPAKTNKCAYYKYKCDSTQNKKSGFAYNWYVINDKRNIAPVGYHVASFSDWCDLLKQYCVDSTTIKSPLFVKIKDSSNIFLSICTCPFSGGRPIYWADSDKKEEQPYGGIAAAIEFIIDQNLFECVPKNINDGLPIICVKD